MKKATNSTLPKAIALLLALATLLCAGTVHAQQNSAGLVQLNDASPSVDATIALDNGAPGVVYVEMQNVAITLNDSAGQAALRLTGNVVTALGLQFIQGAAGHAVHVERLPGATVGQVRLVAQATLPLVTGVTTSGVEQVSTLNGPMSTTLVSAPSAQMPIVASADTNMLTLNFDTQPETLQLADSGGNSVLIARTDSGLSGLSVELQPGRYTLSVTGPTSTSRLQTVVALSAGQPSTLPQLQSPTATSAPGSTCQASVNMPSINLRSGPGTGYTIIGYAVQGTVMPVGGKIRNGDWFVVQSTVGGAWVSLAVVSTSGTCDQLAVYDTPERNAAPAAPVIAPQQPVYSAPPPAQPANPPTHHDDGGDGGGGGHDD